MQCGDLKSRLVRKSCSATAWAVRGELSVTEDLTPMSSQSSQRKKGRKTKKERGGGWRGVGGGKGLESDGRMHAGEINTREMRRKTSGGAPQFTWRIWQFLCLLAIKSHASMFNSYYKGQGANVTLGWSQVCGWNESSRMHCKSHS